MANLFNNGSNITTNLMLNIMSRLKCKECVPQHLVCRNWYNSFKSPEFRNIQRKEDNKDSSMIVLCLLQPETEGLTFKLYLLDVDKQRFTHLEVPSASQVANYQKFIGTTNGVILMKREIPQSPSILCMFNAVTKHTLVINDYANKLKPDRALYALCYSTVRSSFEILMVFKKRKINQKTWCTKYSVKNSSWDVPREIGIPNYFLLSETILIENCFVWMTAVNRYDIQQPTHLVIYDINTDNFNEMPIPHALVQESVKLINLQGKFGMFCYKFKEDAAYTVSIWTCDVLTMDPASWEQQQLISDFPPLHEPLYFANGCVVAMSRDIDNEDYDIDYARQWLHIYNTQTKVWAPVNTGPDLHFWHNNGSIFIPTYENCLE